MKISVLQVLLITFSLISCEKAPTIEGLWIVKSVTVAEDEMTPNARWLKFNSDYTQQSGNGWLQHSIGTWKLDPANQELIINNSNGLEDPYDPFKVTISNNEMIWKRMEDGQPVEVMLERADQLPNTYGDQLFGLWKLENGVGKGSYFPQSEDVNNFLFFKWDKRFVIGAENGRVNGIYNVHGHKPELELIPYGEQLARSFWKIHFEGNAIKLQLLNSDSIVTRTFKRIHEFPQ